MLPAGSTVEGNPKCNGAVLRAGLDGSNLEVVSWGFRNPYGLEIGPDNELYITMHGFDARGSRPVEHAWDCFYRVEAGMWYGWPDFACGMPVTDPQFKTPDKPQAQFLISNHPTETLPKPMRCLTPMRQPMVLPLLPRQNGARQVMRSLRFLATLPRRRAPFRNRKA